MSTTPLLGIGKNAGLRHIDAQFLNIQYEADTEVTQFQTNSGKFLKMLEITSQLNNWRHSV